MTIDLGLMVLGEIMDKIVLDDIYVCSICGSTTLYFMAPKELVKEKHPEAEHSEISIEFPTDDPEPANASVMLSPTKDGMDYDWDDIVLPYEEIGKLIDIGLEKIKGDG